MWCYAALGIGAAATIAALLLQHRRILYLQECIFNDYEDET